MNQIQLGEALKQLRKSKGLLLSEVAEKTGKTICNISLVENGKTNVSINEMQKLANAYGMDISIKFKKAKNAAKIRIPQTA